MPWASRPDSVSALGIDRGATDYSASHAGVRGRLSEPQALKRHRFEGVADHSVVPFPKATISKSCASEKRLID